MCVSVYADEADLNAVVRAVGLLDVSVCKSKAHLSSRRRPTNGRNDASVSHKSFCLSVCLAVGMIVLLYSTHAHHAWTELCLTHLCNLG